MIIAVAITCLRPMIVFENKGLPAKVGGSDKKVKQKSVEVYKMRHFAPLVVSEWWSVESWLVLS